MVVASGKETEWEMGTEVGEDRLFTLVTLLQFLKISLTDMWITYANIK